MGQVATSDDSTKKPQNRAKALSAAYLRSIGLSQKQAAKLAGVGDRTLRTWEHCSWWPAIVAESHALWLSGIQFKTKKSLARLIDDQEPATVRFAAERLLEGLEPPTQRTDLKTGPITIRVVYADEE